MSKPEHIRDVLPEVMKDIIARMQPDTNKKRRGKKCSDVKSSELKT